MNEILNRIASCGIVPVIKLNNAKNAVPLADALRNGGIDVMEITFRTAEAEEAIKSVSKSRPEMLVGAGTVINSEMVDVALNAGAEFIVSPGLNPATIDAALSAKTPIIPGIITPSEIEQGLMLGLDVFKFFPAESFGGIKTVRALSAPYPQIKFVPTGGINEENVADYFRCEKVLAVGGSWMVPERLIDSGDWEGIEQLTREAIGLIKKFR